MLKHLMILAVVSLGLTSPALGQNASHIAKVQSGQSCSDCNLFQADLSYRDSQDMDLSNSRLRQADLSLATFDDINFSRANLSIANLFGTRFNSCNFKGANLTSASAVGAYFGASNLSGANLTHANFSGADLSAAHGLTQKQLMQACGDQMTKLPKGLSLPPCS